MKAHYPDIFTTLQPFDGDFDAFKLQADNCDVIFASYPKGKSIPTHNHKTDNYGIIICGELILTVDGCAKRFGVGDWYHVPAKKTIQQCSSRILLRLNFGLSQKVKHF